MALVLSGPFGERVAHRLRDERMVWLTTIGADLTPQPSPVWFWWDGHTVLIYSRPGTPKLRNINLHPRVALNFDGDGRGGNIIVLTGTARVDPQAPPANLVPEYVAKYAPGFARNRWTAEQFAGDYSVAVRVVLEHLRGH